MDTCSSSPYQTATGNCACDHTDSAGQSSSGAYDLADTGLTGVSDGYCDAQGGNGVFCPELDIFEGNQAAAQVSAHSCKAVTKSNSAVGGLTGPFFPECDMVSWRAKSAGYKKTSTTATALQPLSSARCPPSPL